jgi:hypothetical protein
MVHAPEAVWIERLIGYALRVEVGGLVPGDF